MRHFAGSAVVEGEHAGTPFTQIFYGNAVPPNDIRTRGNGETVAFPQPSLQRNAKSYGKLILRKIIEIIATG